MVIETTERQMKLYAIRRRHGWESADEVREAAARSQRIADDEMPEDVRWIRSYVVDEGDGTLGTVCIFEATSPEAVRAHASRAGLPVDEITEVADTVLVRPDPLPVNA